MLTLTLCTWGKDVQANSSTWTTQKASWLFSLKVVIMTRW